MWYIWITGYEKDGWYAGYNEQYESIEICGSIWGAQGFPTKSAAISRADKLYDNFDEVRSYEVIQQ